MKRRKLLIIISCAILLMVILRFTIFKPRNQGLYKVTILPTLGGDSTSPKSINDKGQIAGSSKTASGKSHLFLWDKENGIRDFGPCASNASLNNAGQITANFVDPNGDLCAFFLDPNTGKTILPTLGGKMSVACEINNQGQIVGFSNTSSNVMHAFIWDNINGICDLTPTSTLNTVARSINDSGQVVCEDKNTFLIETEKEGKITTLPVKISGHSQINNKGNITGMVMSTPYQYDLISWHPDSGLKSLLRSDYEASPKINEHNQIIISHVENLNIILITVPGHLENYLLDPNLGTISLDGYVPVGSHKNLVLMDINNKGWIIGAIQSTKDSKSVGVLFEPITEKMEQLHKKSKARK